MKKIVLLIFAVFSFCKFSFSQTLPPKQAYPITVKQIHSGHSLTDGLFSPWPGPYSYLVGTILGGNIDHIRASTIPGSPIFHRWQSGRDEYGTPHARLDIANWELLSITERVPLAYTGGGTAEWYLQAIQEQKHYLSLFVNNSWVNGNNGNGAPTLLWTTWTNIDGRDGPWRQMLDIQGAEWERMQDYANANRPAGAPPVYIIPGHKMMARLYDDIQLGIVPGITNISQFFLDFIHINNLGTYAAAMIHYACIFNKSPVGLTPNILPISPDYTPPSQALATYLQTMIWNVVTSYPRTGIYPVVTSNQEIDNNNDFTLYPNPATNFLYFNQNRRNQNVPLEYTIFNNTGAVVISGKGSSVNIQKLTPGCYFIKTGNRYIKFIKW